MSISFSQSVSTPGSTTNTTKGDILVSDGTSPVRLPVGSDGKVLASSTTASSGLYWETGPSAGVSVFAKIMHETLTSNGNSSYTISNIPSGYNSLRLIIQGKSTADAGIPNTARLQINGDTAAANYMYSYGYDASGSENSGSYNGLALDYIIMPNNTSYASYRGASIIDIHQPNSTTAYKTCHWTSSCYYVEASNFLEYYSVGIWKSTSAITSLVIVADGTTKVFDAGSEFSLYGRK